MAAAFPLNTKKTHYQARSNSLPSNPHPLFPQFDEHLCRLRASEATSSSTSISHKLSGLLDLQDCVDKLLQLPHTQQALAQERHEKWVDEMLDGSLRVLDVCSSTKDALLHTKECARELQSLLRRRGSEIQLASEVRKYLTSRKVVKKAINKALGNLKHLDNKCSFFPLDKDNETVAMVSMLRDVEAITLTIFESLLSFISGSRQSGWSLVSKLMHLKITACEEGETGANEFAKVDGAVQTLIAHKTAKFDSNMQLENMQKHLENLELCIQDLEEGLHCLFRRLIKTRVSLLNILNH